jgi:hypothetical protein
MTIHQQLSKSQILTALRDLRRDIERDTGNLTEDQTLLFVDICQALSFGEDDSRIIIGQAFDFVTHPIPIRITPTNQFMPA